MGLVAKLRLDMLPQYAYEENRQAIDEENYKTLKKITYWGTLIYTAISAVALLLNEIDNFLFVYLQSTVLMAAGYVVTRFAVSKKKSAARPLLYIVVTVILAVALVLGTFLEPDGISAGFIAAIAVFPSLILDRPIRVVSLMSLITAAFIACSFVLKDMQDFVLDCLNGVVYYIVGVFLTRYRVNEKIQNIMIKAQLEWKESRYRTILSAADDIVFEFDPDLKSYYISENLERYFDTKRPIEKLIHRNRVHPDDRERYTKFLDSMKDLESCAHVEVRFFTKTGDTVWFEIFVTVLCSSDGGKRRLVGRMVNIDARKRREEVLKIKSQLDSATGLYNKAVTEAKISEALAGSEGDCALLLLDIDNLKDLNDTLGHAEGDHAIVAIADVLKSHFRDSDIVGRVGGDEFMVLLKGIRSRDSLEKVLSGLTRKLAALRAGDDGFYLVSGSVGAAMHTSGREDFEQLYRKADIALYRVKKSGAKSGYAIY